jgi:hypothetical protein
MAFPKPTGFGRLKISLAARSYQVNHNQERVVSSGVPRLPNEF